MIGFISIALTIVYILIGWFVRSLCQEDWEPPSLLLALLWPVIVVLCLIFKLLEAVDRLARKIKENRYG